MAKIVSNIRSRVARSNKQAIKSDLDAVAEQMLVMYDSIPAPVKQNAKSVFTDINSWQAATTADKLNALAVVIVLNTIVSWYVVNTLAAPDD